MTVTIENQTWLTLNRQLREAYMKTDDLKVKEQLWDSMTLMDKVLADNCLRIAGGAVVQAGPPDMEVQ